MIFNPIFQREIKSTVRDSKNILLILGFVAVLGFTLIFLWPTSGVFALATESSSKIFSIFLMCNLSLVILLVPALTSPCITSERENKSFALLFTTLLTPGEVLRGKLFSAIAIILLVVLVSLPIGALCSLSGGVGPQMLFKAFIVITVAAITYGIFSLAVSSLCQNTFTALIVSYIGVVTMAGTTWLPYYLLRTKSSLALGKSLMLIRGVSPFDALYYLIMPETYVSSSVVQVFPKGSFFNPFTFYLMGMAVLFVIFLSIFVKYVLSAPKPGVVYKWAGIFTSLLLLGCIAIEVITLKDKFAPGGADKPGADFDITSNDPTFFIKVLAISILLDIVLFMIAKAMFKRAATMGKMHENQFTDLKTTVKRKLTWPFYLFDPKKRKKPISRLRNPVFVAEMRSKIFGKPEFIFRGLVVCIITSLVLLVLVTTQYATNIRPDTVRWVAVIFQLGIVSILAPAISSGAITDEINSNTITMLRMTPLSALKVVIGKLKAGLIYVSIFLVSSLPVLFSLVFLESEGSYFRVAIWAAILFFATITFIAAGFCASAFCGSTSTATAVSYCFAALIMLVTYAATLPGAFSLKTKQLILAINPMVAAMRVTSDDMFTYMPDDTWFRNILFLIGLSALFVLLSSIRVFRLFSKRG